MRSITDGRFRRAAAPALLLALGSLALSGCGDDNGAGGTSTPTPTVSTPSVVTDPTAPVSSTPTTITPPPTRTAPAADVTIDVTIAGGKVSPSGKSVKVDVGKTVKLTGTSDVHDELHVHGYDKTLELNPGKPGSLVFKADKKGSFEVETHESGKLVVKLVVS